MDIQAFKKIRLHGAEMQHLHPLQTALLFDFHGDWDEAHRIAQDNDSKDGAWVHAYLHRKEGDEFNAKYWYTRAGKSLPDVTITEEWETLVNYFFANS